MKRTICFILSAAMLVLVSISAQLFAEDALPDKTAELPASCSSAFQLFDAAGNVVTTAENAGLGRGILAQIGKTPDGLSDEDVMLEIGTLYLHYSSVLSSVWSCEGSAMIPWSDVILKGWCVENQPTQTDYDPYAYFYGMAEKLNVDIAGLSDEEVMARVKQAEEAAAQAAVPEYDAAGNRK